MAARYLIYGLCDPQTGTLRYIGKSMNGLRRPQAHSNKGQINNPSNRTRCRNWIKSLIEKRQRPRIEILEECERSSDLSDAERFWIASIRVTGARLLNHADGGEGAAGRIVSLSTRAKLSLVNQGNTHALCHRHSPETRALMAEKARGNTKGLAARDRISQKLTGRTQSQETIDKRVMSTIRGGKLNKPVIDTEGRIFKNCKEAAKWHKITPPTLCKALKRQGFLKNGIGFKYLEKETD